MKLTAFSHPHGVRAGSVARLLLIGTLLLLPPSADAGDWPQWRSDAIRSGATDQPGPSRAELLWSKSLPYPDPAYDHQFRMCADLTYAPIAAEGLVFVPSNVTDEVIACDLETGKIRWRYVTEGPVRFAPVYADGSVYFGSDDGYLYCVAADDGVLKWRVSGAPDTLPDSRALVGGRLCSRWPVRGAPVAGDGLISFGAGIWPEEGVYVCTVEAETGQVVWRSDKMSYIKDGMSDHGQPYDLSLPPQGYLSLIDGKLAVPSGRSLAAWFDPAGGEMEPYTCFYVKHNPPRGTWYLSGVGQYWVQGGNWFGTRADAMPPLPEELKDAKQAIFWSKDTPENELYVIKNRPFLRADTYLLHPENLYSEPVLTETTMYGSEFVDEEKYLVPRGCTHVALSQYDRIAARDLTRPRWGSTEHNHIAYGGRKVTLLKLEFPLLWELQSPLKVLIKAGKHLYAGGRNTIAAVSIPERGGEPRVDWQTEIDGTPVNALVADEKLVVVTENGNLYCFGSGTGREPGEIAPARAKDGPYGSPPAGYALLLGYGDGARARELAAGGRYRVVVVEPDAQVAAKAKTALAQDGLYGRAVQVIHGDPGGMQLTPYWASLVVIESLDAFDSPERTLSVALDVLRPFTGTLHLSKADRYTELLKRLLADRTGYAMKLDPAGAVVRRQSAPEGADDWTHESGGPENCYASSDRLVKWPLGMLWYSGDVDRYFTPATHFQHERNPYPLVVDGRMFIITGAKLHAVDIYTGSYLWQVEMPATPWVNSRFFDSRVYGRPTERNCVAAKDWVYTVLGNTINAYNVASGKLEKVLDVPPPLRDQAEAEIHQPRNMNYHGQSFLMQGAPQWTEVRLFGDLLITMLGQNLTAIDRHSGELRWTRPTTLETTTYALSEDTLFGLDCNLPEAGRRGAVEQNAGLLFALDPVSGEIAWQKSFAYNPLPNQNVENARLWLAPPIPVLSYNAKHGLLVAAVNRNSVRVLNAADGSGVWEKDIPATANVQRIYSPVVTDDYIVLSNYKGCFGYLFDIRTGEELGTDTGIPRPRTCARIIGNNNLLVYRDAATELYDVAGNRMIGLNSLRSGCTTSFIPAGGIMTAPMLGHGCVCNYPMFASLGLFHWPEVDSFRPESVTGSWTNQAERLFEEMGNLAPTGPAGLPEVFAAASNRTVDVAAFELVNATLKPSGSNVVFDTADDKAGYAIRKSVEPIEKATFDFALKRAVSETGQKRNGNAIFVCGSGTAAEDLIECRLYYGGRSSMMITGGLVETVDEKAVLRGQAAFAVTVSVDCSNRLVTFEAAGKKLTARITGPIDAITHYGYGGSGSANLFTGVAVRP